MPARLILNADDFGLTPGINRAIGELAAARALTSTTLMAAGPAFDDAVAVARAHPSLGIGCHIVLTDGSPVSPPESIPSLLGPDRRSLRPSLYDFIAALLLGRIREEDIARESLAQIEKLQRAGLTLTHVDTHKHTHLFPAVARPLLRVAQQSGIHAIRNPFEPAWTRALHQGHWLRQQTVTLVDLLRPRFLALPQIADGSIVTTEGTIAVSATGRLTRDTLDQILAALPSTGTYELCCHPGYNDADLDRISTRLRAHRNLEREALLAAAARLRTLPSSPVLIPFSGLSASIVSSPKQV